MASVGAEGKRLHPQHGGEIQRGMEMGKQIAAARGFIAQGVTERVGIDGDQQEIVLACKVLRRRLADLFSRGKMEVPILDVDGRTCEGSGLFRGLPEQSGADFINNVHETSIIDASRPEQPGLDLLSQEFVGNRRRFRPHLIPNHRFHFIEFRSLRGQHDVIS